MDVEMNAADRVGRKHTGSETHEEDARMSKMGKKRVEGLLSGWHRDEQL